MKIFTSDVNSEYCVKVGDSNKTTDILEADMFLIASNLSNKRRDVTSVMTRQVPWFD